MWGGPPFFVADNCAVDVRNLSAAREWYKQNLDLRESKDEREEDSGRPFIDLCLSKSGPVVTLLELPAGASPATEHVIFFARDLEKAHRWMSARGIPVDPLETDSGGNRFFRFRDLDRNAIEVCVEPG